MYFWIHVRVHVYMYTCIHTCMYIYIHVYVYPAGGVLGVKNVEAIQRCSLCASLEYRRALLRKDRAFFAERAP